MPEVVAIGEEGTVLSADEDKDIEGRAALALGAFTIVLVVLVLVLSLKLLSAQVQNEFYRGVSSCNCVPQNLGTVSGSPLRSQ